MIGETVKKYRIRKGLTLSDLAERSGIEKSYLISIEEKIYLNPSLQYFEKISPILGIPVDDLLMECSQETFDPIWNDVVNEALQSGLTTEEYINFLESTKKQSSNTENNKLPILYQLKTFCGKSTHAEDESHII
ncbi:helix-turn-helix domain-containing protein [Alkalihalobacterium chitinilyticum]|uniref:Helix-turn-helix domain-containing protein n=1 Tax=Alkalihalobacterium chitinilyticum TaxID=2980103 RepID=A0ABT5VHC0_9BACI|nr:helix-turn-helix transcriptional regulator [Alkalihalobacterium chitinilyticum]MDE5414586.1 helix-turn-helix domain-containing protein [Alkalihalobacterium chitinilyticum]